MPWHYCHRPHAFRRNQHAQHAQQNQHGQQNQHASEVNQHAQENQHACTCSSNAKPSADTQQCTDEISVAIEVSPHVPQATKDNAFCKESEVFNSNDNSEAHPYTVLIPSNISSGTDGIIRICHARQSIIHSTQSLTPQSSSTGHTAFQGLDTDLPDTDLPIYRQSTNSLFQQWSSCTQHLL